MTENKIYITLPADCNAGETYEIHSKNGDKLIISQHPSMIDLKNKNNKLVEFVKKISALEFVTSRVCMQIRDDAEKLLNELGEGEK